LNLVIDIFSEILLKEGLMKTSAPVRTRNQSVSINLEKSLSRYALATAGLAAEPYLGPDPAERVGVHLGALRGAPEQVETEAQIGIAGARVGPEHVALGEQTRQLARQGTRAKLAAAHHHVGEPGMKRVAGETAAVGSDVTRRVERAELGQQRAGLRQRRRGGRIEPG